MTRSSITWEAPEFEYREKDVSWYWITIIIAALVIAFSVWERNFLFGVFIVIAEILVIMLGNQIPRMIMFTLNDGSLTVGEHRLHALKEFESWSTEESADGWAELAFNFRAKLKIPLKVMIPDDQVEEIRTNLKPILREVEHENSFIENIEKLLGF